MIICLIGGIEITEIWLIWIMTRMIGSRKQRLKLKNKRTKTSLNNNLSNVKHPTFFLCAKKRQDIGQYKARKRHARERKRRKKIEKHKKRTNKKENDQTSKKLRWVTKPLQDGLKKT